MANMYADRLGVIVEIEMIDIVYELPSDFLIDLVIDRDLEIEMLGRIDDQAIIEYISSNKLDNNTDLSKVDDDDLLNEVRKRFA